MSVGGAWLVGVENEVRICFHSYLKPIKCGLANKSKTGRHGYRNTIKELAQCRKCKQNKMGFMAIKGFLAHKKRDRFQKQVHCFALTDCHNTATCKFTFLVLKKSTTKKLYLAQASRVKQRRMLMSAARHPCGLNAPFKA